MSPRTLSSSRQLIDTCTLHLHNWRPFNNPNPNPISNKRPCLTDRATPPTLSIEALDMSKLSLFDDEGSVKSKTRRDRVNFMARKRRRRGSRSVSARSCSVVNSNVNGTCSDFIMATDSSGELFVNGDWGSDVSEVGVVRSLERERDSSGAVSLTGLYHHGNVESGNGNESGYGSEPGYRGDAEFGYGGDEFDEEEDETTRLLFWGNRFGDAQNMEIIGENTLQKAHHRCRRKKHELRMVDAV